MPKNTICTSNCGTTANVSFVMVADTPPATLGLLSFKVVPTSIVLTPSTGTATTFALNGQTGYSFDLVRLQSDSAFLGTAAKVPTGAYSSIAVSFFNAELTFFNGTGVALTSPTCAAGAVCTATFAGPFTSTITTSQAISGNSGFGIDINLAKAITVSGATLTLSFTNSSTTTVVSDFTLPRSNSNLASAQLDLIEDLTGIVTISGTKATITPAAIVNRPPVTASTASSTNYDPDPTGALCPTGTTQQLTSCISNNQAASLDAILNSDGTLTIQEIEPLLASPVVDTVEGTVVSVATNSATQFGIVVTDIIPAASGSLIGSLTIGAPLTVNLSTGPLFHVDTKGLKVASGFPTNFGSFANATTTAAIQPGQSVAVHVKAFTAANGTTAAIANNVDTVTLRWSRFIAIPTGTSSPSLFNINTLPGYFGFTQASIFGVEIFTGTPGADGVTNLDGIPNGGVPATTSAIGIRALYINNATNTFSNQAFFAAKVRQH